MRRLLVCGCAFVLTVLAADQASAYSDEDVAACKPDVFRLCAFAIPDERRITACLAQNKPKLSEPCYRVFEHPPSTQPAPNGPAEGQPFRWGN